VVGDVVRGDIVEEMCSNYAEVAVDGCCCAMDKIPLFGRTLWDSWVGVVEVRDHDNLRFMLVICILIDQVRILTQSLTQHHGTI
jgi:hypothetical protein